MRHKNFRDFQIVNEGTISLKNNIPQDIINLYELFKENGKELYIVGGAVRDALMGEKPKDFDLTTNATPEEIVRITKKGGYETIGEVGQKFGVVILKIPSDSSGVEIATFREDLSKGRRPDSVKYSTIDKDVLRRDLTINALFYDIGEDKIVDLVGGLEDIKNGRVKTVGNPKERFLEDPLRKLRILRFKARTDLKLDDESIESIKNDNNLEGVSPERIRDEFKKSIEQAKNPSNYLELITYLNMWEVMFPGVDISTDFINTNTWIIQLAHLFGVNSISRIKEVMNRLKFTSDEINCVIFLNKMKDFKPGNVFEVYKEFSKNSISGDILIEFSKLNNLNIHHIEKFLEYRPSTDGNFVKKKFGLTGPEIKDKIKEIEAEKFKKILEDIH